MKIVIPEYKTLNLTKLYLDFNGTIAVDGIIPESIRQKLVELSKEFQIYILTADTHGTAKEQCEGLPVILQTFPTGAARTYKKELVKVDGPRHCVAIGNGRNDELMLRTAGLSIAIMDKEGVYGRLVNAADICVRSMDEGLDLLLHKERIIADLRG